MYSKHQETKFHRCLICSKAPLTNISLFALLHPLPLCYECLQKFEIIDLNIAFHHYPMRILYHYNEFFRGLLFQYKGLYDYALKDAFLCLYRQELEQKYRNYVIVVAPSSKEDNQKRGFSPIETIAQTFSHQVFTGLYKTQKYKQSDLSYQERQQVHQKINIRDREMLRGKKVLILDDVVTSGSTLLTCLNLVLKYAPQKVEFLVLSTKQDEEGLKFV